MATQQVNVVLNPNSRLGSPMKTFTATLRFLLSAFFVASASAQIPNTDPLNANAQSPAGPGAPPPLHQSASVPVPGIRSANGRTWQSVTTRTNHNGATLSRTNHSFTELGTAMSHRAGNEWVESSASISIVPEGGAATNSAHQVWLGPDANSETALRITLPSGETLSSHLLCLSYLDTVSGSNITVAEIAPSQGLLIRDNRVLYTNALIGDCTGDLLMETRPAGVEQNVILRSFADPARYGLSAATTLLQVWTEITSGSDPAITRLPGRPAANGLPATPDDIYLDFHSMTIGSGTAFLIGDDTSKGPPVRVTKDWAVIGNRRFLVEQVPLSAIAAQVASLPTGSSSGTNIIRHASLERHLPAALARRNQNESRPLLLAADTHALRKPGFLVDYTILTSQTNLTLYSGETYFINGTVNVAGTLVIEPGCCVRFAETNHATIIATNVVCLTEDYAPAAFSSQSDNSIGDFISGNPSGPTDAAYIALDLSSASGPISLSHLRFSYLSNAIAAPSLTLQDVQFVNCQNAIAAGNLTSQFRNVLAYNVQTFLDTGGEGYIGKTVSGENMTVHQCPTFLLDTNGAISLTNCLFIGVTNWQCASFVTNHSVFLNSSTGIFQPTGLGNYYLATNYVGTGTDLINTNLLSELRRKTTFPPTIYSNVWITGSVTLSPQVPRDTNDLTIGFHYPALDYIFSGCPITNANVSVLAGTAIGTLPNFTGYAFTIGHDSSLQCLGEPGNPVRIASVQAVQEQPAAVPGFGYNVSIFTFSAGLGAPAQGLFRFTKWTTVGHALSHFNGYFGNLTQPMSFQSCEFHGGQFVTYEAEVNATNCLFHRVLLDLEELDNPGFTISLYNNLFHGGDLILGQYIQPWTFLDNVFDRTTFGNAGGPNIFHHNAYIATSDYLAGVTRPGDLLLTNLDWVQGPFGAYYQQTNSPLIHAGDRTAGLAGLFDWTVTTNLVAGLQVPESNNILSIGLHYVAADAAGNPLDSNTNGIPDYLDNPDSNTNGLPDYWEILYFGSLGVDPAADPDHDGLSNLQEYLGDTIPTVADPPALLAPPLSQTVFAGTNVTLSVIPTGSVLTNYTFQWRKSSQPIPGATGTSLLLSNVSFVDPANYSVLLSNAAGQLRSPLARLTVWTPGSVAAWGLNDYGQTNVPPGLTNIVGIALGDSHSIALKSDGTVVGWGGEDTSETNVPTGLSGVAAISAQHYHNIALKNDGTVVTWGWPDTPAALLVPASVTNVVSIASTEYGHLALRSDGTVIGWANVDVNGETIVPAGLSNVVVIASSWTHTLAIKDDGTVVNWGSAGWPPVIIPPEATNAVAVSAGYDISAIIRPDGTILPWGYNPYGQLDVPASATNVVALSSLVEPIMALRRDGNIVAWGRNDYGQTDVPPGRELGSCAVAAGLYHSLALYPYDSDGNGLPDEWERQNFGYIGVSPADDPDGDGLSNLQEYLLHTNPLQAAVADTNGVINLRIYTPLR